MSKSKKITFNMIASDIPHDNDVVTLQYDGKNRKYEIGVKRRLGFFDAMRFVRDIAASCINAETGDYTPEGFDFSVRVNTMIYYAGFDAPSDVESAYTVAYNTGLYGNITDAIDDEQYSILIKAAISLSEYTKERTIASQVSKVNDLINKMDEVMQSGNSVMEQLTSEQFQSQINNMLRILDGSGKDDPIDDPTSKVVAFPGDSGE